jgi:hypothetical protein
MKASRTAKEGKDMSCKAASRFVVRRITTFLIVGVAAGPALAQIPMQAPPPTAPPVGKPSAEQTTTGLLEGAVKEVNPGAGTLQVSTGPFGMFWKTLEVTGDTRIQVEGRQAALADIREGAMVKASYETRETKNVATKIEVTAPAQAGGKPASRPQ